MIVRAQTSKRLSWLGRLAVLGLAAVLLPLAPTRAQRADEPRDPPPTQERAPDTTPDTPRAAETRAREPGRLPPAVQDRMERFMFLMHTVGLAPDEQAKKEIEQAMVELQQAMSQAGLTKAEASKVVDRAREDVRAALEHARREASEDVRSVRERGRAEDGPQDPKRQELLAHTRNEVRALREALFKAEARLAELEGRPHGLHMRELREQGMVPGLPGGRIGERLTRPPVLSDRMTPPFVPHPGGPPPGAEQEQRLRELERKFDRVLEELEGLKKQGPRERQ